MDNEAADSMKIFKPEVRHGLNVFMACNLINLATILAEAFTALFAQGGSSIFILTSLCTIQIVLTGSLTKDHIFPAPYVSLFRYFLLFLGLFYLARAFAYAIVGDADLMVLVGVTDPNRVGAKVLIAFGIYIYSAYLGHYFGLGSNWFSSVVRLPKKVFCSFDATAEVGPYRFVGAALAILSIDVLFWFLQKRGLVTIEAFTNYVNALPQIAHGALLAIFVLAWWKIRKSAIRYIAPFGLIVCVIIVDAILVRDVTIFRMQSLACLVLAAYSVIARWRIRISWVVVILLISLPVVNITGRLRYESNAELQRSLAEELSASLQEPLSGALLKPFRAVGGDFTCFDVSCGAFSLESFWKPYGLSYLYPFVHFVPRSVWASKPVNGVLTADNEYLQVVQERGEISKIPYYAGLVGDSYLEGGWLFVPILGFFAGFVVGIGERAIVAIDSESPVISTIFYTLLVILEMMWIRSKPYEMIVYIAFIFIGVYLALMLCLPRRSLIHATSISRKERRG